MMRRADLRALALGMAILVLLSGRARAYIGPGGGLSLLPMALAMVAAFSVSAVVVITWPYRAMKRWLRRRREKQTEEKR
jgi:hypothetical protein